MSHGKKSKRKKRKKQTTLEHTEVDKHLNKRPPQVDITGRVEANFPPELVKKYDTAGEKEEGWNRKIFVAEIIAAILLAASVGAVAWQGFLLRDSNRINREALTSVQRAFVNFRAIRAETKAVSLDGKVFYAQQLSVAWENTGTTPAKNAVTHIEKESRTSELPPGFEFPDRTSEMNTFVLGPKELGYSEILVPVEDLDSVRQEKSHFYMWGWVVYRDAFKDTPERLTEFCAKLELVTYSKTDIHDPSGVFGWHTNVCQGQKNSCYDEDCPDYAARVKVARKK